MYTVFQKCQPSTIFVQVSQNELILIFGTWNPEDIWH